MQGVQGGDIFQGMRCVKALLISKSFEEAHPLPSPGSLSEFILKKFRFHTIYVHVPGLLSIGAFMIQFLKTTLLKNGTGGNIALSNNYCNS